jgi:hypothetical protein
VIVVITLILLNKSPLMDESPHTDHPIHYKGSVKSIFDPPNELFFAMASSRSNAVVSCEDFEDIFGVSKERAVHQMIGCIPIIGYIQSDGHPHHCVKRSYAARYHGSCKRGLTNPVRFYRLCNIHSGCSPTEQCTLMIELLGFAHTRILALEFDEAARRMAAARLGSSMECCWISMVSKLITSIYESHVAGVKEQVVRTCSFDGMRVAMDTTHWRRHHCSGY